VVQVTNEYEQYDHAVNFATEQLEKVAKVLKEKKACTKTNLKKVLSEVDPLVADVILKKAEASWEDVLTWSTDGQQGQRNQKGNGGKPSKGGGNRRGPIMTDFPDSNASMFDVIFKSPPTKSESDPQRGLIDEVSDMSGKGKGILKSVNKQLSKVSPVTPDNLSKTKKDLNKVDVNKDKIKLDRYKEITKKQINLEKLVSSDPVISEADPNLVASLYLSLTENFPTLSKDINTTRYILREAIQYEGIPVTMLADLADIEESIAKRVESQSKARTLMGESGEIVKTKVDR